jgi:hypothetical protein
MTFGIAALGAIGLGGLAYAVLRKPRYLYDGEVVACEGSAPVYGVEQQCVQSVMKRGGRSGKVHAPFAGVVESLGIWRQQGFKDSPELVLRSDAEPVTFRLVLDRGAPMAGVGTRFKAGEVIGQSEWLRVSASRGGEPLPPSAWLVANCFVPSSRRGKLWCEDEYQQIVPRCSGITFRAPELPKFSLRTVRMTLS